MKVNDLKHQAKLAEWKANILECRSQGLSVSEWCAAHGCHRTTYYKWEREIFGKLAVTCSPGSNSEHLECVPSVASLPQPELVELPVAVPAPSLSEETVCDIQTVAVVHVGKYELKLSNSVSPELMRQLKGLVEGAD